MSEKIKQNKTSKKNSAAYDAVNKVPDYEVSELAFVSKRTNEYDALIEAIKKQEMSHYYLYLKTQDPKFPFEESLYQILLKKNEEQIKQLEKDIKEAEKNDEGELEKAYSWVKLGEYYAQIGDVEKSLTTLEKAKKVSISLGGKIDIMLTAVRIALFFNDQVAVSEKLNEVHEAIEKGGDWERRNRFKA